jgi:excisionase family DNA binding protein
MLERASDLPQKPLLRPDEVAQFLSVSLKTIYRWHRSGILVGTKINRSLRIPRDSVLALIQEETPF